MPAPPPGGRRACVGPEPQLRLCGAGLLRSFPGTLAGSWVKSGAATVVIKDIKEKRKD